MSAPNFFAELKRRNVYKVAVAYAVVSWLLIQVATQVFPFFEIPNWAVRLVVLLLILGFPIALILSWAFEITPEGIKRESEVTGDQSITHHTGRKLVGLTIVIAVIAAGLFCFQRFGPKRTEGGASAPPGANAVANGSSTSTDGLAGTRPSITNASVAVLPLVNTSGDSANDYFSDGLSEELIAVLAKIPGLKVIGRSSSFLFKGKSDEAKTIGEKLGVANLIEGSVRKQGERVRIVAELINAADGRSLWSETYDRELKDVFAVQSEIATAVADQMKVKLLGQSARPASAASTENPTAHNAVLQADFYFQQQTQESLRKAIVFLQEAVGLDPNYAVAYAKLGQFWRQYAATFATEDLAKSYENARQAADKAVSLAPDLDEVRMTVGLLAMNPSLDFATAEKEFRHVLQSAPNNAAAKGSLAFCLLAQGRLTEAEKICREAISLDPLLTTLWYNLARTLAGTGRYAEAEAACRKGLELQPSASRFHVYLATIALLQNRPEEAMTNARLEPEGFWRNFAVALVQQTQTDRSAADAALKDFIGRHSIGGAFQVATLYAVRKEPDPMFQWLETAYATHDSGIAQLVVAPFVLSYRSDPRFTALCQRLKIQAPEIPPKT